MQAPILNAISRSTGTIAALLAGATVLAALTMAPTPSRASDLMVTYDQSQLLRLPRPVAEIIIGNPAIADVSVQSSKLLIVTGKSFGITNIIALDAERNVISDQRVVVQRDQRKIVSVQKGGKRQSYNCAAQCNPAIVIGDDKEYFASIIQDSQRKIKMSEGQAGGGGGGGR